MSLAQLYQLLLPAPAGLGIGLLLGGAVLAWRIWPRALTLHKSKNPPLLAALTFAGIDLYLAGHTHGGQVRLHFYGAIVTLSAFGKRFEMGRYQVDQTTLYVSRGIGMEGLTLPRVRFLCPPEIVLIELGVEQTP